MIKEKLSKINWKKVQITSIKVLFIAILNTALWVYLIGSMVPYATFGQFKLSWIDYLKLSDKVAFYHIWLLYIGIAIGIILTLFFIKWWIEASKKEKDKQELIATQEANTAKIVEAITKEQQKKEEKANKDVEKYL